MIASTNPIALDLQQSQVETMEAKQRIRGSYRQIERVDRQQSSGMGPGQNSGWRFISTRRKPHFPRSLRPGCPANPDVIEAEQNVVKARVVSKLAKLHHADVIVAEDIRLITTQSPPYRWTSRTSASWRLL